MLTPEQEAWLVALESGRYQQGRHQLRDGDYYCCLGVACAIQSDVDYNSISGFGIGNERATQILPFFMRTRLNLHSRSGELRGLLNGHKSLVAANDDGVSFKEIAAFIREDPSRVFRSET